MLVRIALAEEFPNNLPRCGDKRYRNFQSLKFKRQSLEINAAEMFIAGQQYRAAERCGLGKNQSVVDLLLVEPHGFVTKFASLGLGQLVATGTEGCPLQGPGRLSAPKRFVGLHWVLYLTVCWNCQLGGPRQWLEATLRKLKYRSPASRRMEGGS